MSGRGLVRWGPTLPYASPATALMDRLRQRRIGHMNIGKASFSIRHDDGSPSDITVYNLEHARNIVATFGVPSTFPGGASHVTVADLHTIVVNGNEIGCHSSTHPTTTAALFDAATQILGARAVLEAVDPLIRAELWVTPGTVTALFDTDADWATALGEAVRRTYIAGTGFSFTRWGAGNQEIYGVSPNSIDTATLATVKALVDQAVAHGTHAPFSLHPYNLDQPGQMTTADYTAFLDYLRAYMDAGTLENVTVTGGIFAMPWGDWEDLVAEGDFANLPYASSTWGPWVATGVPVLHADGGPTGPNYVTMNSTNRLTQTETGVVDSDVGNAHYRFRCKVRCTAGGVPRITLHDSTDTWRIDQTFTVAADAAWHTIELPTTVPAAADELQITVRTNDANWVDFADIEMKRL